MSLQNQISNLAVRIGTECKSIRATIGNVNSLSTTDKTSLVAAVNELNTVLSQASQILDTATNTAYTWSASKIISEITLVKSQILDGAPAAYDTLIEIANKLSQDSDSIGALLTAVGNKVAYDQAQTLTTAQKSQALENIGGVSTTDIGDTTTNFVTIFEQSLV